VLHFPSRPSPWFKRYKMITESTERAPWYARLFQSVLDTAGPTALVAIATTAFLMLVVWRGLHDLDMGQDQIRADIERAHASMAAFAATQAQFNEQRQALLEKQLRILRQLCVNSAKSDIALRACVE